MDDKPREQINLDAAEQRLAGKFPTVDAERVDEVFQEVLHSHDEAHVRDFIPVLVEHEAAERLREEADPLPLAERFADGDDAGAPLRAREEEHRSDGAAGPLLGGL